MKSYLKYIFTFVLSFLAIFYSKCELNILLTIPLLAFFMFNGLGYFITCVFAFFISSYIDILINNNIASLTYFLIAACLYFICYHLSLLINKKILLNFFGSINTSIILTYLIYFLNADSFDIFSFLSVIFLSTIISFLFSFLVKKFSFFLLSFDDEYSPIIIFSILSLYLGCISLITKHDLLNYLSLFSILFSILYFSLKGKITSTLSINAIIIVLSYLFNISIIYENILLILICSSLIAINKSKINYLNSLLTLICLLVFYFMSNNFKLVYYFSFTLITTIFILFIKMDEIKLNKDQYYIQYVNNRNEMLSQLDSFKNMFISISNSFKNAKQNRILSKAKEEVFNSLCSDCPNYDLCHKKGKHLLLNYVKYYLNDELDDNKIRYIKQNCIKQDAYFKLLDTFTTTYLIKKYQNEHESRMQDIISTDFYCFSEIMKQSYVTVSNDKLMLSYNFFKNIKEALKNEKYDVIFVNNLTNDNKYRFQIAIKNIKRKQIEEKLLPTINYLLQTNMVVDKIETATLSFNYFIIYIKEKEELKISYAIKQSNEDIKANGDSYFQLNDKHIFYIAISDGMGHGIEANEESKFALDSLSSMLKAKIDIEQSISLTNNIIQLKNDFESYTTLDLCAIDKQKQIISFFKLGAFNSYIIRDHKVTEVNNFSLPIGIIDTVKIIPSSFKIQKGDIIIMCSDGMIDETNKSVINVLEDISMDYPNVICKLLFSHLIDIRQNSDDATLIVITIQ